MSVNRVVESNEECFARAELHGSDRAWDVLGKQVELWGKYRSGFLEKLAETIMKGGISIDAGLDEMVRNGIIPEWRIKK